MAGRTNGTIELNWSKAFYYDKDTNSIGIEASQIGIGPGLYANQIDITGKFETKSFCNPFVIVGLDGEVAGWEYRASCGMSLMIYNT
jgi:hypothetical protein